MRLHELFERRTVGIRPGIEHLEGIYDRLGRPAAWIDAIHIVGTNGKGSTAAMCDQALRRHGLRVGLYTSPHLVAVNERIRIDGIDVTDETLQAAVDRVLAVESDADRDAAGRPLSFFEVLTLAALLVFDEARLDAIVVEAGLGGRLDATRLVRARVVVVTSIGLDHQQYLGDTLEAIAAEKGGAFRPTAPVLVPPLPPSVDAVLRAQAAALGCPYRRVLPLGTDVLGLPGPHQRSNAALALCASATLVPTVALDDLAGVRWPGRLERVGVGRGELWFDVGHNPEAIARIVEFFTAADRDRASGRDTVVVFGCPADRPAEAMMSDLSVLGTTWWVPIDPMPRPAAAAATFDGPDSPALLTALRERLEAGARILVIGSHRLVGPLRRRWVAHEEPTAIDPQDWPAPVSFGDRPPSPVH